jgi:GrpB-like predicted nucleotidyltransferase (UPF0157 family)/hemoglobin-like flavoprotein
VPLKRHPVAVSNTIDPLGRLPLDTALVSRLRATYERVRTHNAGLATIFYTKLFAAAPHLRSMFRGDLDAQQRKLIDALDAVVVNFERPAENAQMLAALGARHAQYGAKPEHYDLVIQLLVESMETLLGNDCRQKELEEWRMALRLVSDRMIAGSKDTPPSTPVTPATPENRPSIDPEPLWRSPELIVLAAHDPRWLSEAAAECHRIARACGSAIIRVEHIGSTSVPGLIAKPVLDLMPVLRRFEDGFACVAAMRALGYWYAGDFGIAGRHLFVKGSPRTHHAHMLVEESREARRHIAVRDVLRARPEMAARYASLKQQLASQFGDDRESYAQAKTAFMRELLDHAGVD